MSEKTKEEIRKEILEKAGIVEGPPKTTEELFAPPNVPEFRSEPPPTLHPQATMSSESPFACGYMVGLKPNGEFVFEIVGKDTGLVQLLGIHKYAEYKIGIIRDINQGYGMPLILKQTKDIGEILKVILNLLTKDQKTT